MITEDYVSFETAKLLKEKGFNEMTELAYEIENGHIRNDLPVSYWRNSEIGKYKFSCPTLQMAMKWLREVHNIVIVVTPSMFWGKYNVSIYKKDNDYPIGFDGDSLISSYEEAIEAALKYTLENLI